MQSLPLFMQMYIFATACSLHSVDVVAFHVDAHAEGVWLQPFSLYFEYFCQ